MRDVSGCLKSVLTFAMAVLLVPSVLETTQAQQTTFKSNIELVHVDAVVVDNQGRAVRGLGPGDFVLTDRKRPQVIATFDEIARAPEGPETGFASLGLPPTLKADVASNSTRQSDHLVVLVVDDLHVWKGRTEKTKQLAREVVTKLGAQASMAVLFTSGEHNTQVTQDRSELLFAVESVRARQAFRRPHEAKDDQKAAYVDPDAPAAVKFAAIRDAQMASLQDFEDNMRQFKTMEDAAKMVREEVQRRKAFILISEGIMKDLAGVFDSTVDPCSMFVSDQSTALKKTCFHADAMRDMMDSMRRSGVAMYAIDPRGRVRPEDMAIESWPPPDCAACTADGSPRVGEDSQFRWLNPVRQAQDGLRVMAEASGGFAVTDSDDLTSGVQRIIDDIDHYYLLGFYPADPTGSDKYRPLGLTVIGHPDYTVRFRRGYMPGSTVVPPKNKDPLVELAAGVMPKSDVPLRLTALPLAGNGKAARVVVALEVTAPTGGIKDLDSKLRDDLTYSLLVVDDKKSKVTQRSGNAAKFSLSGRGGDMPDSVTYQIPLTIELNPGRYQLRASAMSKKLDKGGSVYLDVTVPDFSKTPLVLSGIALGFADGPRVPVGRTTIRTVGRGAVPAATLPPAQQRAQSSENPLPFEPTLSREFALSDVLRAYAELTRTDSKSTVALTITLLDLNNRAVLAFDKSVGPGEPGKVDLRLPLGALTTGAYVLRITATDSHTVAKTETGIVIK